MDRLYQQGIFHYLEVKIVVRTDPEIHQLGPHGTIDHQPPFAQFFQKFTHILIKL
jgi:hypothetical protein